MTVFINPGSGPVAEATEQHATHNTAVFILDLSTRNLPVVGATRIPDSDYGDGRYAFSLAMSDGRTVEVQMPGLPLDRVRWLGAEGQDIWDFPRLYVDDSSWIWFFALNAMEPDDVDPRQPNGTVQGGEPYVFNTIRLGGDEQ